MISKSERLGWRTIADADTHNRDQKSSEISENMSRIANDGEWVGDQASDELETHEERAQDRDDVEMTSWVEFSLFDSWEKLGAFLSLYGYVFRHLH